MTAATIPDAIHHPPYLPGMIVYDRRHDPTQPQIVTGIELAHSNYLMRDTWTWRVLYVAADNPTQFPHAPFNVDDLAREPWTMGGGE